MKEETYRVLGQNGVISITVGIIITVVGITVGILSVVAGAQTLRSRRDILL